MDVSIIYVNWNCAEDIQASAASIREHTHSSTYEILVVDNNSPDGPGTLADTEGIRLIRNRENKGFGAGCNLGAGHARGRYLMFLNPDTLFLNDVLATLINFVEPRGEVAMAGPMVLSERGAVMYEGGRSLPTLFDEFLQHSTLSFRFPHLPVTSHPYLSRWDHRSTREVEAILGACMLIKAATFREIGGFDERFFLYSEEIDLCYRLRQSGGHLWYVHTAEIMHKERQSTIQLYGSVERIVLQNMKSQHYYFLKHYGRVSAFVWRWMIACLYLVRYAVKRDAHHLAYIEWAMKTKENPCSAL